MFIPAKIGKNFLVNRFSLFYFPKTFQKSIAVFCSCSPSPSPRSSYCFLVKDKKTIKNF